MLFGLILSLAASAETLEDSAKKVGVTQCLKEIKTVSEYVFQDRDNARHTVYNIKQPNKHMYIVTAINHFSDSDEQVSMVFSPTEKATCDWSYFRTYFSSQSCSVLREESYSKFDYAGTMLNSTLVLKNKPDTLNVYLTPQGNGCMVQTREVSF